MSDAHYTGTFTPLPVMVQKAYPRMVGPGFIALNDNGLTVMGHGVDLANPTSARLRVGFWLLMAALVGWTFGLTELFIGVTLGLLSANAVRQYLSSREPSLLHSTVPWPDVDRVKTDGDRLLVFTGSMVLFGSPIPNPLVFQPEDAAAALEQLIQEHLDKTERSKALHVID